MSECQTCNDHRVVGGHLPAPCPACVGNDATRRIAALEAALIEACKIASVALGRLMRLEHPCDWQHDDDRIAALRAVARKV